MVGDQEQRAADPAWTPPAELDGFRVIRQLGRGGMGTVYLGHDDTLDRPVALKFLAAADLNAPARDRFLIEARAIARLHHPNVVGIYRVGEVLGRPYLAYELVTGHSLDELAKPVPWARALELVLGVARGLAAAHQRDVLHRDIKPANVMLAASGEIKLLDFGLAKLLDIARPVASPLSGAFVLDHAAIAATMSGDPSLSGRVTAPHVARGSAPPEETGVPADAGLTAAGAILGTPLYMAPELWRGEPATMQSDVYALGLLLYELMSGGLPHRGLRGMEIAEAVQTRDPPPIRTLCPTAPQALADVVDRAIRRQRDERFQSAQEVRDALEAIRSLYMPFVAHHAERTGDDDATLIAGSFARVAPRADELCARVYQRLFDAHPELRSLFPADMTGQRRKLLGALTTIVENLEAPSRLIPLLEDLGRRHAAYGVKPDSFEAVGAALLGALGDFDDQLDEACVAAWQRAYAHIAQAMQRGLAIEQVTIPPGSVEASADLAPSPTRYARNGDVGLAYQQLGSGALDLVVTSGWLTHLEAAWQWPPLARFLRQLAGLGRLIIFDGRGTGLSDPGPAGAQLEERAADLRAVLDAAGVERAALVGLGEGSAIALQFAVSHPERTRALVLYGANARTMIGDGHPHGLAPAQHDEMIARMRTSWGEPLFLERFAPSMAGDEAFRAQWARHLRAAAGPGAAIAHHRAIAALDVRSLLPEVRVPVRVLHRDGDAAVPFAAGQAVADEIRDARFIALAGGDHLPFVGNTAAIIDEARRFLRAVAADDGLTP